MRQLTNRLEVKTSGKGLYDCTAQISSWVRGTGFTTGILTLFIQHTSASLTVQENADPDVIRDLNDFFGRIAPEDRRRYRHAIEGPDDMPAHIRAALTQTQISVPVVNGALALGTWQAIYVFEHRGHGQRRVVLLHLMGE
jgi:secondary thiamine-phosphate synthase enzyme